MPRTIATRGWTSAHAALTLAMVAIGVALTFDSWADIARIAVHDEESSHVMLVPLVVGWMVWVRRGRLRACHPTGGMLGSAMLGLGWLLYSLGYRRQIETFWHGGAVLVVAGAALTILGKDAFFKFLPAFGVLVFLVPVPGTGRFYIAQPLQTATARVTQGILELLGMSVERQGNLLQVNDRPVAIAEACNGMRMVFTLFLVCYVFAFITPLLTYVRLLIILTSPITAVLCNVMRLIPTVWLYGHVKASAASAFHDIAGWVMLAVAFLLMMGIVKLLRWAMIPVAPYTLAGS